jgi:hypothetical protein
MRRAHAAGKRARRTVVARTIPYLLRNRTDGMMPRLKPGASLQQTV